MTIAAAVMVSVFFGLMSLALGQVALAGCRQMLLERGIGRRIGGLLLVCCISLVVTPCIMAIHWTWTVGIAANVG
jgi:hypothetical protein